MGVVVGTSALRAPSLNEGLEKDDQSFISAVFNGLTLDDPDFGCGPGYNGDDAETEGALKMTQSTDDP